jgi:hypothetical protein
MNIKQDLLVILNDNHWSRFFNQLHLFANMPVKLNPKMNDKRKHF